MNKYIKTVSAVGMVALLAGCNAHSGGFNNAQMGTVIGGVAGGVVGNQFGKGSGKTAATALGAVIGGMLGHNNSNKTAGTQRQCKTELRWKEEQRTIYSHSHITFWYEGKKYTLKFKK